MNPQALFSTEFENIPTEMRKFLTRNRDASSYEKTWENFCGVYNDAFDLLAEKLLAEWHYERVTLPLFFLCRHSIELSIKRAIIEYAEAQTGSFTAAAQQLDLVPSVVTLATRS